MENQTSRSRKTELIPLAELKPNEANPRSITDDKFNKLVDSLLVFPRMLELRPLVIDVQNVVLGGNMRLRALDAISQMSEEEISGRLSKIKGFRSKPKTEKEAIVNHWRTFLDKPSAVAVSASGLSDEQVKEFIIKDNVGFGSWDWDELGNTWDSDDLAEWGLDVWQQPGEDEAAEDVSDGEEENIYTSKVESPQYKPSEEKPAMSVLADVTKYQELMARIEASDVPEDEKQFLRLAASRHIAFDYGKIADYYAHSDKEMQALMEDSLLVIIDIDDAIERGYVALQGKMNEMCKEEMRNEE